MIQHKGKSYPVVFGIESIPGGQRFAAWLLDLPGCIAQGGTRGEALERLVAIASAYLDALERRSVRLPEPTPVPPILPGPMGFYDARTGQNLYLAPGELPHTPSLVNSPGFILELCEIE